MSDLNPDHVLLVANERRRQKSLGWTTDHDKTHGVAHIGNLIAQRCNEPKLPGESDFEHAERMLVQIIALGFAGLEVLDV